MANENRQTSGVQELIAELQQQGVAKGRADAEKIVADARQHAMRLVDDSKREAESIVSEARAEAERMRASGEAAVRLAGRDAVLALAEQFREEFAAKARAFVGRALDDDKFLRQLLLEIARAATPERGGAPSTVLLPSPEPGELAAPSQEAEEKLNQLALALGGEALRGGIAFDVADFDGPGVRVRIADQDVEVDLTAEAMTRLLLQHLSPRFREIIEDREG